MKYLRGAVAIVLALMATSSFSQDRRLVEAFHCPDIDNDIARLECFDKAYGDYLAAAHAPGDWILQSETNPLDDTITTLIGLNAKEGSSALSGPHQLVIRCEGADLSAWIKWQRTYGRHDHTVTSRVGQAPAKTEQWLTSSSANVTFYPGDTQQFVRDLIEVDRFAAQIALDDGGQKLATFNVKGLREAVTPIRETCLSEPLSAQDRLIESLSESLKEKESR